MPSTAAADKENGPGGLNRVASKVKEATQSKGNGALREGPASRTPFANFTINVAPKVVKTDKTKGKAEAHAQLKLEPVLEHRRLAARVTTAPAAAASPSAASAASAVHLPAPPPTAASPAPAPINPGLRLNHGAQKKHSVVEERALAEFGHSIIALFNSRPANFMAEALELEKVLLNKIAEGQEVTESDIVPLSEHSDHS